MKRLRFEFVESFKIAYAQIAANRTRSFLTALGVIIGIVAVTLMGTAIGGINTGFNRSMALLGDDILYVSKHPLGDRPRRLGISQPPRHQERICRAFADHH